MKTMKQITDAMDAHRNDCAPGSECQAWQDYVDDCFTVFDAAPWDMALDYVPSEFANHWLKISDDGDCE